MTFIKGQYNYNWIGKKHSEKSKIKMSETKERLFREGKLIGFKKGQKSPCGFLGKRHSEETKDKMRGKNNPNWKGGISFMPYPIDWIKSLRESIRQRDNYACKICRIKQIDLIGFHKKLDVHHIDYDKKNLDPKNLISLCRKCHNKTNFNRNWWINYFRNL